MAGPAKPAAARSAAVEGLALELFDRSGAAALGLSAKDFGEILRSIAAKYLDANATNDELSELLSGLHLEELVLARACAAGHEKAWEIFLTRYRERLYTAAAAIAKDDTMGRELAQSIYADLYGTRTGADGARVSKLNYYSGRGSLEGWLRTVLAQEFVNNYRGQKKNVSLEAQAEAGVQFPAPPPPPQADVTVNVPFNAAIDEAVALLAPEQRFLLSAYYLDGRTLAEIGRMLGVHESTVSRKVERVTKYVRQTIVSNLIRRGMSRRAAEEALETDVRDISLDLRSKLAQETAPETFLDKGKDTV